MELGLLVAAMTMTYPLDRSPSINVSSWLTTLFSTSPCVLSLLGAIESSSSMKIMAGEFFSASSNAFLKLFSASPAILDIISGPFIKKKKAPVSLATARAIKVFPDPYYYLKCIKVIIKIYLQFISDLNIKINFIKLYLISTCLFIYVFLYINKNLTWWSI